MDLYALVVPARRLFALLVHKAEKPTADPDVKHSLRPDATFHKNILA